MEPRDYTDGQLADVGAAVFHGHVESRNDSGKYSGIGRDGEPIKEALTAYPYGFRSYAPLNTGLVLTRSQAGLLVLSQENALPSGVTEPKSGEALLYNSQGATVLLDEDGDINITQKAGREVLIGNSPTQYAARADRVLSELENFQMAYDAHKHSTSTGPTGIPDTLIVTVADPACDEVKIK